MLYHLTGRTNMHFILFLAFMALWTFGYIIPTANADLKKTKEEQDKIDAVKQQIAESEERARHARAVHKLTWGPGEGD
jgi:ABC-type transport system involved in cytochrome bd biosynthesis fused ATPase/permease subunit